jgi:hypothetical protein
MTAILPDKYIRKEIYDRIHNMDIGGTLFKCYDTRATQSGAMEYTLVSTQLNQPEDTKCGGGWSNSTEIQVIIITEKNTGSRVLLDDAVQEVLSELNDFSLPVATGLRVSNSKLSVDNEIIDDVGSKIAYRKIVRMQTTIN